MRVRISALLRVWPDRLKYTNYKNIGLSKAGHEKVWGNAIFASFRYCTTEELLQGFCRLLHIHSDADISTCARALQSSIFNWAMNGFEDESLENFRTMHFILINLLTRAREHAKLTHIQVLWTLSASFSCVLGLSSCRRFWKTHSGCRVIMRGMGRRVQMCLLTSDFESRDWKSYVVLLFRTFVGVSDMDSCACVYGCFVAHQNGFYIGKANVVRATWASGSSARFCEHCTASFHLTKKDRSEIRYKVWRAADPENFFMIPFAWQQEKKILMYEKLLITKLQPNLQTSKFASNTKTAMKPSRAWPKRRSKICVENEIRQNLCQHLVFDCPYQPSPSGVHNSFQCLVKHNEIYLNISGARTKVMMYSLAYCAWLVHFLAESGTKLDWQTLWNTGFAFDIAFAVWLFAAKLPAFRKMRCRKKINHFLRTHGQVCTAIIRVPFATHDFSLIYRFKRILRDSLLHVGCAWNTVQYIMQHVVLYKAKGLVLRDLFESHISFAKQFDRDLIANLPESVKQFYLDRGDLVKSNWYADLPLPEVHETMLEQVLQLFQVVFAKFEGAICVHSLAIKPEDPGQYSSASEFFQQALSEFQFVARRSCELSRWGVDPWVFQNFVKPFQVDEYRLAVTLDKDEKRVAIMDKLGYWVRLEQGYLCDREYYIEQPQTTVAQVADMKQQWVAKYIPRHFWPRVTFDEGSVQYAYHNYKGKCIDPLCHKNHAHTREIISDKYSPLHAVMNRTARCVRQLKKMKSQNSWTLWNQLQFDDILNQKVQQLCTLSDFRLTCVCGAKKDSELQVAKLDAAQFFKNASVQRAIEKIKDLIGQVKMETGLSAIAVKKKPGKGAKLVKKSFISDSQCDVMKFKDIKRILRFVKRDKFFTIGRHVVRRRRGWPMGGSMSEPGTCVDLNSTLESAELRPADFIPAEVAQHVTKFSQCIAGILHVDDSLAVSKIFCASCMHKILGSVWPADVGTTLEEQGCTVRMLSAVVHVHQEEIIVMPYNPNGLFALGFAASQQKARLGPFRNVPGQTKMMLRTFLVGQLLVYDKIIAGRVQGIWFHFFLLISEVTRLDWPDEWICGSLVSIGQQHRFEFACKVRKLGKLLKKAILKDFLIFDFFQDIWAHSTLPQKKHHRLFTHG